MSYLSALLDVDYWQARQLFALCNLIVCSAIGWACICRIAVTSQATTRGLTRWSYAALLMAATASGFGPLLGSWPGGPETAMNAAILLLLLDGVGHWRRGVPDDARHESQRSG